MGEKEDFPKWKLYSLMIFMLIFGTSNTIVMKLQDMVKVGGTDSEGKDKVFTHPYFQCANMFVGELMCLFVYFGKTLLQKKKTEEDEVPLSPGT